MTFLNRAVVAALGVLLFAAPAVRASVAPGGAAHPGFAELERVARDAAAPRLDRTRAIEALEKLGDRRAIPVLTGLLTGEEKDSEVRAEAARRIRSFAAFHGRDQIDLLGPLFHVIHSDSNGYVRSIATDTIRWVASPARFKRPAAERMIAELGDPASLGHANAAIILGDLGDRRAIPALIAALGGPSGSPGADEARAFAARSLARLASGHRPSDESVVPALIRAVSGEGSSLVRSYAGDALAELGGNGSRLAVDSLVRAFDGAGPGAREDVVQALGRIGDPAGLAVILRAAGDPSANWDLKIASIHALEAFPERPETVAPLVKLLSDPEEVIRGAALEALEKGLRSSWAALTPAARLEALLAAADFLGDSRSTVRGYAARILRDRLLQLAESDAGVREALARCFPEAPGPGLGRGGALLYMVDMVVFLGFPGFTSAADRQLSEARVVPPPTPWAADDISRIKGIIRGLIAEAPARA